MELRLNKKIYDISSINGTIKDYKQIANISVNEEDDYWCCRFVDTRFSQEKTIREFENYLIAVIASKGR